MAGEGESQEVRRLLYWSLVVIEMDVRVPTVYKVNDGVNDAAEVAEHVDMP